MQYVKPALIVLAVMFAVYNVKAIRGPIAGF